MWGQKADKLAETLGVDLWHEGVLSLLRQSPKDQVWAVACSGGLDSLCLLLSLFAHFPQRRQQLRVLHLNHNLRGPDSDGDALFVQEVCAALGLVCAVDKMPAVPPSSVSEAAIREWRLGFYAKMLREWDTAILLQGHHADDVLETMLMRLSRGSNVGGLASPRPISHYQDWASFLRPFINLPKDTLKQAMACNRIFWREDKSNSGNDFYRNGIRNELVPKWNILSPAPLASNVTRTRMLLEETDVALQAWAEAEVERVGLQRNFSLHACGHLPRAILRRVIYAWAKHVGCLDSLVADQVDALLDAVASGNILVRHITPLMQLRLDGEGVLHLEPIAQDEGELLWQGGSVFSVGTAFSPLGEITCTRVALTETMKNMIMSGQVNEQQQCFLALPGHDVEALDCFALAVRPWQAGDRYVALGSAGSKKLQDCFVDKKIESKARRSLPVVCIGQEIVWCPGLAPAEAYRIEANTAHALRLTYLVN